MNTISMQSSKTALLSTLLFLTRLPRASDQDVVQGSRSRTPYSCPLPQSRGIPAIPTHPSVRNSWHAVNVGSPQLCTDRHTCARFWFPSTRNSWFRNDALKSAAGEPLWDYACNCTLIRWWRCCECACCFCGMRATFPLPPLAGRTTRPICPDPGSCCILCRFFFKHRNTHSLTPPWAICHTSLWGSLVVVLSSKLLCCISQPNAHLTSWRPLQVSSLWGVCRVLTYSDTYAHDPVTALTWMMNWLCCGSLHTAISLSSPAQGCSFISGYCVSAVHTTHSAQDKQPRKYWEKLLF